MTIERVAVRAGFRCLTRDLLAGGPVELEFFVESDGELPLQLAVTGDRMRQRPGRFSFAATFDGSPLPDPSAGAPDLGGPVGTVPVSRQTPWRQPLNLNQFVRLEATPDALADGAAGRLDLTCRRPLTLASSPTTAMTGTDWPDVEIALALDLRRDDAALARLVAGLLDQVTTGQPAERERALGLLLPLRSAARDQIDALTRHRDPTIADRARAAEATLRS